MNSIEKCEAELAGFLGLSNCVAFSCCRNALHGLLLSLDFEEGDEVVLQEFICDCVIHAVEQAKLRPVLVDVNENTFNLDAEKVRKKITSRTKAIVFVHTYGNPSGIVEIKNVCDEKGLLLIEDLAHSLGGKVNGKSVGGFGDYAVSSFTKQMLNFGGGAVISNNDLSKVRDARDSLGGGYGIVDGAKRFMASLYETRAFKPSKILIDYARKQKEMKLTNSLSKHYKCSKVEALLLLKQLKWIPKHIEKQKKNYEYIKERVKTQNVFDGVEPSYNYLTFVFENKIERDSALSRHQLFLPAWKQGNVSERILFVPNNHNFKEKELKSICDAVRG